MGSGVVTYLITRMRAAPGGKEGVTKVNKLAQGGSLWRVSSLAQGQDCSNPEGRWGPGCESIRLQESGKDQKCEDVRRYQRRSRGTW